MTRTRILRESRIRRWRRFALHMFVLFLLSVIACTVQKSAMALYEKKRIVPDMVSNEGLGIDRFRSLTPAQRRDVLRAKRTLVALFHALLLPHAELSRVLDRGLYETCGSLLRMAGRMPDRESALQSLCVTRFDIEPDRAINLHFYLVSAGNGQSLLRDAVATLKKHGARWKLNALAAFE